MDMQKILKLFILALAFFSLFINSVLYFYLNDYEKNNYGEYNLTLKKEFIKTVPLNAKLEEIDYSSFCSNIKPNLFLANSAVLSSWSGLMFIISAAIIILFILFKRKTLSKKYMAALLIILLASFMVFVRIALFDEGYNYIECQKFW